METIEEFNENFDVKKPKKKGLLITVISIIALVIALIATYFLIFTKPQFIFSKAIDKMFVKTEDFDSMKLDYKLKASVETDDISIQQYTEELEKCTLKFGLQLDAESKQEVVALGLDYKDEQVIDLKTYYNNEGIYLYLDEIFEKYIKVDMAEKEIEAIKEAFEQFSDENIEKSNTIMEIFRDELKKQIKEEGTFEKTKETIKIDGKEQKVTKYTLNLSQESLINILSNMFLNLSKDEEFLEAMGDDSFKSELEKASKALIENSKQLDKDMLNVKINIYTKGILNNFAGMDIEINSSINNQKAAIVFNMLKESKEIYEYSIKMKTQGINAKVLSGKIENQIEKDTKNEGKGKVIITAKVPEYIYSLKANIEVDYSIEVNNGIDKIDVSNSVNMKDLTEKDIDSITKKLMTKPLIGEFLTSMDDGLYEDAKKASEETKKAMIKEQINMVKTELFLAYYEKEIELNEITEEKVKKTIEPYFEEADIKVIKTPGKLEFTITIDGIENKMNLEDFLNVGQGEIENSTQEPISQNEVKDEYCGYSVTYSVPNGFKYDSEFSQNHYKSYSTSEMDANISLDGYTEAAYIQEINLGYEDYLKKTEYYRNVNLSTTKTINVGDKNFKYVILSYEASLDNNGTIYYEKEQEAYIWYALDEKNMFKIELKSYDKDITEEIIKGFLNISVKEI